MYTGQPCRNFLITVFDPPCSLSFSDLIHQLADLANLTTSWAIDISSIKGVDANKFTLMRGFKNTTKDVPIALEELEREYCRLTNQPYPIIEMLFVRSWMLFRVRPLFAQGNHSSRSKIVVRAFQLAIISQGIAARYARRQASSEQAYIQGQMFPIVGKLARAVLEDGGVTITALSKL